ncbi:MAG TPA: hypothetical protein VH969_29705 [Actinophytocola sp.]|jgi:hypothetical protein|uniref:hypothetical protein n=1 Tax=Actinophytocola sp. TaxID=1872138 RepID=UPI002F951236
MRDDDPELTAEVVLRPAGRPMSGWEQITAETVAAMRPDEAAVSAVRDYFQAEGFTVSPLRGISSTITGPRAAFERQFGATALTGEPLELPLDQLPRQVSEVVQAITFSARPDYGPGHP